MAHSKFQPDHNGRRTPDATITPALSLSHGLTAGIPHKAGPTPNIARDSTRGKHVHAILAHGSSTPAQVAGAGTGGRGHATVYDGGANLLPHAYGSGVPKVRDAAPVKYGQRSRVTTTLQDLGRTIKTER
jgi:hypothetical protein